MKNKTLLVLSLLLALAAVVRASTPAPEIAVQHPAGTLLSGVVAWGFNDSGQTNVPVAGQADVTAISAGGRHTLALKSNGSVIAWGLNDWNQATVPVTAQSGVIAIAAGDSFSVALKNDGSVVGWGQNPYGQITVPAAAQSGVIAIAAGSDHTVALKTDGSVLAWGWNGFGQTTVPVAAQAGVIAIAAGGRHTVALKSDGSVIAWGDDSSGQATVPVAAQAGVTAIAAGLYHTVALKSDGSVLAWGLNGWGQSGVPVAAQAGVTAIAAGFYFTLALKSDGSVVGWGENSAGQATVPVTAQSGVTAIAGGFGHTVVLKNAPLPVDFGNQLVSTASAARTFTITNSGTGPLSITNVSVTGDQASDFTVDSTGMLTTVTPGSNTTFTVTFTPGAGGARGAVLHIASDDSNENPVDITLSGIGLGPRIAVGQPAGTFPSAVLAWGKNDFGQSTVPVAAQSGVTSIAAGNAHTVGLKIDGSVLAWGWNSQGQTTVPVGAQSGVTAIAAGSQHTVALKTDGSVIAWGWNLYGQTTVPVAAQSGVIAIAAGFGHTAALKNDGSVIAWGLNDNGQTTVPMAAQADVIAIASGSYHILALKSDGSVVAWGYDAFGQATVPVNAQSDVTAIAAGFGHSVALKSDGEVIVWGWNQYGQTNVPVEAQSGVTAIGAGLFHTAAVKNGGVVAWGQNFSGQATVPATAQAGVTAVAGGEGHTVALKTMGVEFGYQIVSISSAAILLTITNLGNGDLILAGITKDGADSGDFSVDTMGMLTTLAPGAITTFTVHFTPAAIGARSAVLHIANNDSDQNPFNIALAGIGASAAEIAVEQPAGTDLVDNSATIAFGNINIGSSNSLTFTITNKGSDDLTGLAITRDGAQSGEFNVGAPGATTLAPGASTTFTVTFIPAARGTRSAALHIASVDTDENPFDISLTGAGVAPEIDLVQPAGTQVSGVVAWGSNSDGQTTVPAEAQAAVTAIAAGKSHTVALINGSVVAWGLNDKGQTTVPVQAQGGVTAIAAGELHTLALRGDGSIVAWGDNTFGQTTVPVAGQSGVSAITAGVGYSMALKNGGVIAWGLNSVCQLCVPFDAQSDVIAIAAGYYHAVALKSSGRVVAWGFNIAGQTAVPAAAQSGVIAIAAGEFHTVALKNDGSVLAWGFNLAGETTVPAAAQSGVIAIAAGSGYTVALKNDGRVVTWGSNTAGQTNVPVAAQAGVIAIAAGAQHIVANVLKPLAVGFGDQLVSTSGAAVPLTITNLGEGNLILNAIIKNGTNPGDFSVDTTGMVMTVAPGASTTFTVTFTPAAPGVRTAFLHIPNNDSDENPLDIELFGQGSSPPLLVCPADLTAVEETGQNAASVALPISVTGFPGPALYCFLGGSNITSPHWFPVGTNLVTCTATNVAGTSSCAFNVVVCPATNVVTTLADSGPGSLREAIELANDCPGTNYIVFNVTGTIMLLSELDGLTDPVFLLGPGPTNLTVSRCVGPQIGCFPIFFLNDSGIVWLSGLTIANGCDDAGGGVYNTGNAVVSNCVVTGNVSFGSEGGAGIYNESDLLVVDSSIVGNMATNNARGGGIYTDGSLVLANSVIAGNSSQTEGGGLYVSFGDVALTNVTFSGNSATNGGGIYLGSFSSFVAASITIASNTAPAAGGGIFDDRNDDAELKNTIVAGNTAPSGPDVSGTLASLGHNLLGDGTGSTGFTNAVMGDQVGTAAIPVNPVLGPLRNNGGPTFTHALPRGSPAVNTGDNALAPPTDQRGPGFPRIAYIIDIGAYELLEWCDLQVVTGPADQLGCLGAPAVFSITVTSALPYTVQWGEGELPINGATNTTFTVTADHDRDYSVEVQSPCGAVTKRAHLTVPKLEVIGPDDVVVCMGQTTAFLAESSANIPVAFAWCKDGVALPGQTNFLLIVTNAGPAAAGVYSIKVSTPCDVVTNSAMLRLTNPPSSGPLFLPAGVGIPDIQFGAVAWGDYDRDGLLDLLITGEGSHGNHVFHNDGNGVFSGSGAVIDDLTHSDAAWVDFDKDGFLDLAINGDSSLVFNGPGITKVYRNLGGTNFVDIAAPLTGTTRGSVAWGDVNNDTYPDLLIAGSDGGFFGGGNARTELYLNDTMGNFTNSEVVLPGIQDGRASFADYDKDGYLDILITGDDGSNNGFTKLLRNNHAGQFVDSGVPLAQLSSSGAAWGDCNNDGFPDLLLFGYIGPDGATLLYTNSGSGSLRDSMAGLPCVVCGGAFSESGAAAWGDYDGDGFLDFALSGSTNLGPNVHPENFTRIYHNNGHCQFTDSGIELLPLFNSALAWGDYDRDGVLDLIVAGGDTGADYEEGVATTILYHPCQRMSAVLCAQGAAYDPVCGHGTDSHALWLPGMATDFDFNPEVGMFMENSDGTATITGEVRSRDNPKKGFMVTFSLSGLTTNPPPDSPKRQLCDNAYVERGGPINPVTWRYYTGLTGVLTGIGSYTGAVVKITRVGPAFQVGVGASGKNFSLGASAWFTWVVTQAPRSGSLPRTGQGDINIDLFECDDHGGGPLRFMSAPDCLVHYGFEEPSGTNALDSSGSNNHGFLVNGPARTNGLVGRALRFDGSNDRVVAMNPVSLNVTGAVTVAAWVRPESVSGTRYILIKGNASNTKYAYSLRASDAKVQYRWVSPGGSENKFSSANSVLAVGRWTHVAVAHTPGSLPQLFINGVPVAGSLSSGSATALLGLSSNPFTVGASSDGSSRFQGLIDEVFVCAGALTAAEIQAMTNAPSAGIPGLLPSPAITTTSPLPDGRVGAMYSQSLLASGGTPGFTWSVFTGALPPGLALNTNNGTIHGVPTLATTNAFLIRVLDSAGRTAEQDFTLAITNGGAAPPASADCLVHWNFDEANGAFALDNTGHSNDGTLLNGPARIVGRVGGALRFDGSNDRVVATNATALNTTGAVTVACWARPESVSGSRYLAIKGSASNNKYAYALRASDAKLQYRWTSPSGSESKFQTGLNVLTNGQWTHVAVVHTPGSLPVIYINGLPVPGSISSGSATALRGTSANPFTVGASSDGSTRFQGAIDEVFVCAGALSPVNLSNLMLGLPPGPALPLPAPNPLPGTTGTREPLLVGLRVSGGATVMTWVSVPGQTYRVQYKSDLGDAEWEDLTGDIVAASNAAHIEDYLDGQPQRFYRVVIQP